MNEKKKVVYDKHSKWFYLGQAILSVITLRLFYDLFYLFAYFIVNHTMGVRLATIGKGSKIHPTVLVRHGERVVLGKGCFINHNNVLQGGKSKAKLILGDYVQTGPNVMMFAFNHGTKMNGIPMIEQDYIEADTVIDDDVWVGGGTVIVAGVHIGKGCVIGANSVVTKDLPENYICAGVPCKPIKPRV